MNIINKIWVYAVIVSTLMIMYVTLSPGTVKKSINVIPFQENIVFVKAFFSNNGMNREGIPRWFFLNLIGNLVLFLPFGFCFAGLLSRLSSRSPIIVAILAGILLSLCIELIQLFIPTRATDIDDVIFNTVSTCFGVMVFSLMKKMYKRMRVWLPLEK